MPRPRARRVRNANRYPFGQDDEVDLRMGGQEGAKRLLDGLLVGRVGNGLISRLRRRHPGIGRRERSRGCRRSGIVVGHRPGNGTVRIPHHHHAIASRGSPAAAGSADAGPRGTAEGGRNRRARRAIKLRRRTGSRRRVCRRVKNGRVGRAEASDHVLFSRILRGAHSQAAPGPRPTLQPFSQGKLLSSGQPGLSAPGLVRLPRTFLSMRNGDRVDPDSFVNTCYSARRPSLPAW